MAHAISKTTCFNGGDVIMWRTQHGNKFALVIQVKHPNGGSDRVLLDNTLSAGRFWKTGNELFGEGAMKVDVLYLIREANCRRDRQRA